MQSSGGGTLSHCFSHFGGTHDVYTCETGQHHSAAGGAEGDKKSCKRYGPCGVGEQALYLNSFFIDRRYYVALESVRRVFKRVAMSKGGFTGKGPSAPSLSGGGAGRRQPEAVQLQARGGRGPSAGPHGTGLPGYPPPQRGGGAPSAGEGRAGAKRYLKQLTPQRRPPGRHWSRPSSCWRSTRSRRRSCPRRLRPSGSMTAAIPPIAGWRWPSS